MAAEKATATILEFENRGRQRWILEIAPREEGDPPETIVFGDSADRNVLGTRHPVFQRDPVVRLTREQYEKLTPASRKLLDKLVETHEIDRRELAA
jgi:hypothetical protein